MRDISEIKAFNLKTILDKLPVEEPKMEKQKKNLFVNYIKKKPVPFFEKI